MKKQLLTTEVDRDSKNDDDSEDEEFPFAQPNQKKEKKPVIQDMYTRHLLHLPNCLLFPYLYLHRSPILD